MGVSAVQIAVQRAATVTQFITWVFPLGSRPSLLDLRDAHMGEQRQVISDVPIIGDVAVRDLEQAGRNEIDRRALTFG